MWNLEKKQKKNPKLIDTENRLIADFCGYVRNKKWLWVKWVKVIKQYEFPVTKINKSRECIAL